jgi:hypothetical protein
MRFNLCLTCVLQEKQIEKIEKNREKWGNNGWDCIITIVSHPKLLVLF